MVVRFDNGVVRIREIIEALQPIVISFCSEDIDYGGTTYVVFGGWKCQLRCIC